MPDIYGRITAGDMRNAIINGVWVETEYYPVIEFKCTNDLNVVGVCFKSEEEHKKYYNEKTTPFRIVYLDEYGKKWRDRKPNESDAFVDEYEYRRRNATELWELFQYEMNDGNYHGDELFTWKIRLASKTKYPVGDEPLFRTLGYDTENAMIKNLFGNDFFRKHDEFNNESFLIKVGFDDNGKGQIIYAISRNKRN